MSFTFINFMECNKENTCGKVCWPGRRKIRFSARLQLTHPAKAELKSSLPFFTSQEYCRQNLSEIFLCNFLIFSIKWAWSFPKTQLKFWYLESMGLFAQSLFCWEMCSDLAKDKACADWLSPLVSHENKIEKLKIYRKIYHLTHTKYR